ncbi:MAG: hypothetical protein ACE5JB_00890 [bacterium]
MERLEKAGIEVDKILLYGYYARKGADEHSDLDLAIISS